MTKTISTDWADFACTGTVIAGAWEGDASVPYGKHMLPTYVEDICVLCAGIDITDVLAQWALDEIEQKLLDTWSEGEA